MKTFREIAADSDIPESTLRLYRDAFEPFVPAVGVGRRRRYDDTAAALLLEIARRKRDGESDTQIRQDLESRRRPAERARQRSLQDDLAHAIRLLDAQNERLDRLEARLDGLHRAVAELRAALTDDRTVPFDDLDRP